MKNNLLIIFFVFILSHCGFSPIYINKVNSDYKIIIEKTSGDKYINSLIENEINKISNSESTKNYYVIINTQYEKIIMSKDTKGSPSEYQIRVKTDFTIKHNSIEKNLNVIEKQNLENISDLFEQKNYENTIKKNFAALIVRKLNLALLNIE